MMLTFQIQSQYAVPWMSNQHTDWLIQCLVRKVKNGKEDRVTFVQEVYIYI